jgi:hypothetical protein
MSERFCGARVPPAQLEIKRSKTARRLLRG